MDIENITKLVKLFDDAGLSVLDLKDADFTLRLEKILSTNKHMVTSTTETIEPTCILETDSANVCVDFNELVEIKSPMIGVVYLSPSPGEKPYVEIGDRVKKGDVLCLIEAMKVFNEVISEYDGEIVDICIGDGQVAEFSQVLFKIY